MYQLSLNAEELLHLRSTLEFYKVNCDYGDWTEELQSVLYKLTLAQIDTQEQDENEAIAARYAANLHAMPEGS